MNYDLEGKTVVITGGSSGIGEELAVAFAKQGCNVAVCGRDAEKLRSVRSRLEGSGTKIYAKAVDVCDREAVFKFADDVLNMLGPIDIWVNNAGRNLTKPALDVTEEDWDALMAVDLKGTFFGAQAAAGQMKRHGGGVIINNASFAAKIPQMRRSVYAAAKSAVLSLTRSLAAEWGEDKIRVVSVTPGLIETPQTDREGVPQRRAELSKNIALHRLGRPSDIADPILFLSSDGASYITGTHIEISGGKFCVQDLPDYFAP